MSPEQEDNLLATVARIDERTESIQDNVKRHEQNLNDVVVKVNTHDVRFAKYRGGMSVLGILFTALLSMVGFFTWRG